MPVTQAVGFIGLGVMGSALSSRLIAAGWQVTGYDIDPAVALAQGRGDEEAACVHAVLRARAGG